MRSCCDRAFCGCRRQVKASFGGRSGGVQECGACPASQQAARRRGEAGSGIPKSEVRSPKSEVRKKSDPRTPNPGPRSAAAGRSRALVQPVLGDLVGAVSFHYSVLHPSPAPRSPPGPEARRQLLLAGGTGPTRPLLPSGQPWTIRLESREEPVQRSAGEVQAADGAARFAGTNVPGTGGIMDAATVQVVEQEHRLDRRGRHIRPRRLGQGDDPRTVGAVRTRRPDEEANETNARSRAVTLPAMPPSETALRTGTESGWRMYAFRG